MEHAIMPLNNYLIIVDDSKIKDGDYRVNIQRGYVKLVDDASEYYNQRNDVFKKVIAHLPLGSPILQGVDLLPPLEQEDDVEKLAYSWSTMQTTRSTDYWRSMVSTYKEGYNKAKEKYKYTERDLSIAIALYMDNKSFSEIIQSLSQSKMPIGFECEMKQKSVNGSIPVNQEWEYEPKTTTNPQGQTVWVGKYIY